MRFVVIVLLILGAHFSLTPFAPAAAGKGWALWPFATDSKPWLSGVGGLPQQPGSALTPALAGVAGLGFLVAALSLFRLVIPADWWSPLVLVSTVASLLLYALYFGPWALLPMAIDAVLLWGMLVQNWSVISLGSS
ncbi:MAG: hypothetical protein M5U01_37725 [Ardenticatenaceae bacterium]|nr:hypothetical protein [Ardenticatenaceae bacterium]HBY96736.1 hypothetical protein [Chloroflexota bacterium]